MLVICDFDGTITNFDTLDFVIEKHYGKTMKENFDNEVINGDIDHDNQLRKVLIDMKYDMKDILQILNDQKLEVINHTFCDFYKKCIALNFDFYVLSSGFREIIEYYLPYIPKDKIIANDFINFHSTTLKEHSVNKVLEVNRLSINKQKEVIYIGDGISDFSVVNDITYLYVKKNSHLEKYCDIQKVDYYKLFTNFTEIIVENHLKLLSPGVVRVDENVLVSSSVQHVFMHRQPQFHTLYAELSKMLRQLVCDDLDKYTTLFVTGSGTTSMDEVINAYVNENMLILSNGMFGERWAEIANYYNKNDNNNIYVERNEWGVPFDKTLIEKSIIHNNIKTVIVVHCDTSVGILNDIHGLGCLIKNIDKNIRYVVDSVSTFGGIPINMCESGIDILVTNPNKALASIMGIGIIIGRNRVLDELNHNSLSYSLNLKRHYKMALNNETCNTCSISAMNGLLQALKERYSLGKKNVSTYYHNYQEIFDMMYHGVEKEKLLNYEISCPCLITILSPSSQNIINYLFSKGYVVYECKGKLLNLGFQVSFYGKDGNKKNILHLIKVINEFI